MIVIFYIIQIEIYKFRSELFNIIKSINFGTDVNKIIAYRELTNFVNDNLYEKLVKDLFINDKTISVDELLYYVSKNTNECFDIFIEHTSLNLSQYSISNNFLQICDSIFFNCCDKVLYNTKVVSDNIIKHLDKRICNFNIRYHRSDIRENYLNIAHEIYYKNNGESNDISHEEFISILKSYIDYLFDDTLVIEFNDNLKLYNEHKPYYEKLIKYYEISKELIIKQYNKSIFKNKLELKVLKKIIIKIQENLKTKSKESSTYDKKLNYNDILNIELSAISMNLYSIFRMFINNWNMPIKKERINLTTSCNNLDYPKNIIYFAGGAHNTWIIQFIKLVASTEDKYIETDIKILSEFNNNYIKLDNDSYIKLKEFITPNIDFKSDLDMSKSDMSKSDISKSDVSELYSLYDNYAKLIKSYIDNNVVNYKISKRTGESKINKQLESINLLINELIEYNKLIISALDNELSLDNESSLSNESIYSPVIIKNLNIFIEYLQGFIVNINDIINLNNDIKIYFNLLIKNINNIIIIINYLNNKININELSHKKLLEFYNRNENLNYIISNSENIIEIFNEIKFNDIKFNDIKLNLMKGIDIENIDDIDDIYYFISYLYNNIKDKDDEISIPYNMNIENTFEFLSKLIENIQTIIDSLDENIESNEFELLYYYFTPLHI